MVFSGPFAPITDTFRIIYWSKKAPYDVVFTKVVQTLYPDNDIPDKVGLLFFGRPIVMFNKARQLDELFVTKNSVYTKHDMERRGQYPLTFHNIAGMHTDDPLYKKKKKALSAAFYKSKMSQIAKIVKQTTLRCFSELQAKGSSN